MVNFFPQSLSRAYVDQNNVLDEEDTLKAKIIQKLFDLDVHENPEMADIHRKEFEEMLNHELPGDPEMREEMMRNLYEELGQSQGPGKGHLGGRDPFDPFKKVPLPR